MALPEDVLQSIATYLPYNERVNMNQILPLDRQIIKKLNSDAHNLAVRRDLVAGKLLYITRCPAESVQRLRKLRKILLYLLHTKDDCLFRQSHQFLDRFKQKALYYVNLEVYPDELVRCYFQDVKSTIRVCQQVISYLDGKTFTKLDVKPMFVKIE